MKQHRRKLVQYSLVLGCLSLSFLATKGFSATAPNPPTGVTAKQHATDMIVVTWTPGSGGQAGFNIYRMLKSETGEFTLGNLIGGIDQPASGAPPIQYVDTTAVPGKAYRYGVSARNTPNGVPNDPNDPQGSESAKITTTTAVAESKLPDEPTHLTVTRMSNTDILVSWTPGGETNGFLLLRKVGNGSFEVLQHDLRVSSFDDKDTSTCLSYCYRVIAFNAIGYTPREDHGNQHHVDNCIEPTALSPSTTPLPAGGNEAPLFIFSAPGAPNINLTTLSSTQVNIAWSQASGGPTGYYVQRLINGTYQTVHTVYSGNAGNYTDTPPVPPRTDVWYRVVAYNSSGSGTPSQDLDTPSFMSQVKRKR